MEAISVFDIFKIGVGPSSSHTMGPWRAAQRFAALHSVPPSRLECHLYGSLAKTGRGHGTDFAVMLGLSGQDPEFCDVDALAGLVAGIRSSKQLPWAGTDPVAFDPSTQLKFHMDESLPGHPNAMRLISDVADRTYYSVGGGFVVEEGQVTDEREQVRLPFPIECAEQLREYCELQQMSIPQVVMENELHWRSLREIHAALDRIWCTMVQCIHRGCHVSGILPGGLLVKRRAAGMNEQLMGRATHDLSLEEWLKLIDAQTHDFQVVTQWVSCFALAVNEENASYGRVVTAPTNGAAGVIPAVLAYHRFFQDGTDHSVRDFLLTAGELGSLFKKGATISAAMGGCQAEIGVSSAMAAGALCQVNGGSTEQVLMAAEIAMEHHLGMTCDPIGGLVQIPCIERNTMGAIKAIAASQIALISDPSMAKVSLDQVISTMWKTALDMNTKYKETSEGGLATQIPVIVAEC